MLDHNVIYFSLDIDKLYEKNQKDLAVLVKWEKNLITKSCFCSDFVVILLMNVHFWVCMYLHSVTH